MNGKKRILALNFSLTHSNMPVPFLAMRPCRYCMFWINLLPSNFAKQGIDLYLILFKEYLSLSIGFFENTCCRLSSSIICYLYPQNEIYKSPAQQLNLRFNKVNCITLPIDIFIEFRILKASSCIHSKQFILKLTIVLDIYVCALISLTSSLREASCH